MNESFFILKTLSLKRSEARIIDNVDENEQGTRTHSYKKNKSKFDSCVRYWFQILVAASVLGTITGLILVKNWTENKIDGLGVEVSHLKTVITGNKKGTSNLTRSIDKLTLRNQITALKNSMNEIKRVNARLSDNMTQLAEQQEKSIAERRHLFKIFFIESNTTLCSQDRKTLISPVKDTFKLEIKAVAKGHLYAGETIFKVVKNSMMLNGGSVKVTQNSLEKNNLVKCVPSDPRNIRECIMLKHDMLLELDEGEELRVEEVPFLHVGRLIDITICMTKSKINIPLGLYSVNVTH